jgi:PadR family transcriptional regulator
MSDTKRDLFPETLDFLVLETLARIGPLHGFGIARRSGQVLQDLLRLS